MRTLALSLLAIAAIAALALGSMRLLDARADRRVWLWLTAQQPNRPLRFDPIMVTALPDPARRFFNFSITRGTPLLTVEQAQTEMKAYMTKRQAGLAQRNREEGAKFLAGNKTKPGVITTPSGLQYMVLRQGNGQRPMPTSRVRVNYEGKLLNGEVFDSSYARGEPAEFPLNGVIAGWTEGVSLMPVGAKYRFWIPSNLAYGEGGAPGGKIGPDATLTFDVELMGILQ